MEAKKIISDKVVDGAKTTVTKVGDAVEGMIDKKIKSVKKALDLDDKMTAGQKAGKVMEKFVDVVEKGVHKLNEKIEEQQAKKFASAEDLKIKGRSELIGEAHNTAITTDRVTKCKEFVAELNKMPKKEVKEEIIKDAIRSASINLQELQRYLKLVKKAETKAEVDYINKEIAELVKLGE